MRRSLLMQIARARQLQREQQKESTLARIAIDFTRGKTS
jgi:hypothetical protein